MKTVTSEIFAVGTWNGTPFKLKDLEGIVKTFHSLKSILEPPLKMGHNKEQKLKDGEFAIGWVDDVWLEGEKLVAKFTNVPEIVFKAFKNKLYRKVSIELLRDVEHKGINYKHILSGVALLGANLPAVNTIADIGKFVASDQLDFTGAVSFTAISNSRSNMMDITQEEYDRLKKAEADGLTFSTDNEKLKKDAADKLLADAKSKVEFKRKEITESLEKSVKEKHITPAQRDSFTKIIRLDDDDSVINVDIKTVEEFISSNSKSKIIDDESGRDDDNEDDDMTEGDASDKLDAKINTYMAKHGEEDYEKAMFAVMKAEPKLSEEFKLQNGTIGS